MYCPYVANQDGPIHELRIDWKFLNVPYNKTRYGIHGRRKQMSERIVFFTQALSLKLMIFVGKGDETEDKTVHMTRIYTELRNYF